MINYGETAEKGSARGVTDVDVVSVRTKLESYSNRRADPEAVDDTGRFRVIAGLVLGGEESGEVSVRLSPESVRAEHGAMDVRDCSRGGHGLRRCLGRCHT